jgi:hypothetical protein
MEELSLAFEERLQEIESYLKFLEGVEAEARFGVPRLGRAGVLITVQQQRILYSGIFLQLYNLVEATVVRCLDSVTKAATKAGMWLPGDLSEELRQEWVRVMAHTHIDLNYENRLKYALVLCQHLIESLPVTNFRLESGGGGSWDDSAIEDITTRLGCQLKVSKQVYQDIKRPFKDDLGPLALVKKLRNSLAHGSISFSECGENLTVGELRDLMERTAAYLREVVNAFGNYIIHHEYLEPAKRPTGAQA